MQVATTHRAMKADKGHSQTDGQHCKAWAWKVDDQACRDGQSDRIRVLEFRLCALEEGMEVVSGRPRLEEEAGPRTKRPVASDGRMRAL